MIHYRLRCADGHEFEGWFRDSLAFDDQSERGLLSCPQCGATEVRRGLMAPFLSAGRRPAEPAAPTAQAAAAVLPDQLRAALQRMRAEIERRCDDVGDEFVEAARRLHRGEDPPRGIYGQASETECEALAEEGIEVTCIPWLPRAEG